MLVRPAPTEAAEYYSTYIDKVPGADIVAFLAAQASETIAFLQTIGEEKSLHRYEPGKWSLREALSHINDAERVFSFRALWFARGAEAPMPGFDQDAFIVTAGADARSWASHVAEFAAIREATITLVRSFTAETWSRGGTASGMPVTVRALVYIIGGHVAHHRGVIEQRYL